jgi:hypothetical protein
MKIIKTEDLIEIGEGTHTMIEIVTETGTMTGIGVIVITEMTGITETIGTTETIETVGTEGLTQVQAALMTEIAAVGGMTTQDTETPIGLVLLAETIARTLADMIE